MEGQEVTFSGALIEYFQLGWFERAILPVLKYSLIPPDHICSFMPECVMTFMHTDKLFS